MNADKADKSQQKRFKEAALGLEGDEERFNERLRKVNEKRPSDN
jgi:hypothetical protein